MLSDAFITGFLTGAALVGIPTAVLIYVVAALDIRAAKERQSKWNSTTGTTRE